MKNKYIKSIRYILLAVFLILITVESYLHQVLGGGKSPSIHALCPYGAVESLYSLVFGGTYIAKIFTGTFALLVLILIIALIFRRSFCGLICPFGALQEFSGILGRKIFKKRFVLPKKIDRPFRYLKYIILIFTIYFAWKTSGLWVDKYDPWAAYGHITEGLSSLTGEYLIGSILLIITIIGSVLYNRFFCKYLCPMGALYGIISKLSPSKIVRNKDKCISCGLCSKNCPVNIDVANSDKIASAECINCQSCMLSCPKDGALEFKAAKKTVKPLTVIIIVMIIFWGGILLGKAAGIMETTPKAVTSGTKISVEEIKGYMTLTDVSTATGISLEDLYKKLSIPDSVSADTMLKEVKNYVPDFEVETAKEILEKN